MKILVQHDDGQQIDVTEAVQITYDSLHASMDYNSGFLDGDELQAMVDLAEAAGFDGAGPIKDQLEHARAVAAKRDSERAFLEQVWSQPQRRTQGAREARVREVAVGLGPLP